MSIVSLSTGLCKSLISCRKWPSAPCVLPKTQSYPKIHGRALATAGLPEIVPYRKQLKDEAKQRRLTGNAKHKALIAAKEEKAKNWELTVGIEVHAQLNTEHKLFSSKPSPSSHFPNNPG